MLLTVRKQEKNTALKPADRNENKFNLLKHEIKSLKSSNNRLEDKNQILKDPNQELKVNNTLL